VNVDLRALKIELRVVNIFKCRAVSGEYRIGMKGEKRAASAMLVADLEECLAVKSVLGSSQFLERKWRVVGWCFWISQIGRNPYASVEFHGEGFAGRARC
jgi:hypothetical protein